MSGRSRPVFRLCKDGETCGAGGLGDPIVSGLALSDVHMILSGAIPAAVLALIVDLGLHGVERRLSPPLR